jgi:CBS domain-containing protein
MWLGDCSLGWGATVSRGFGAIAIGENDRLIGMVTDRDVTVRAMANGTDVSALTARDIMTKGIVWCRDGDDVNYVVPCGTLLRGNLG